MIRIEGTKTSVRAWTFTRESGVLIDGLIDEERSDETTAVLVECDAIHPLWGHSGGSVGREHRVPRADLEERKIPRQYARRLVRLGLALESRAANAEARS